MSDPAESLPSDELRVGTVIAGKYRVERVLGSGAMGVVVCATHTTLGQRVAIKIMRNGDDPRREATERFVREARAAARIQSDHVVRVVDIAELPDGTPYMIMEYLEGCDLRDYLARSGPVSVEQAAEYVLQACEALAEAHAAGIVHRDLKPSNLFLAQRSNGTTTLKVLDFGISKFMPSAKEPVVSITATKVLMGSPLYMSPEQMNSARDVDARADVWSLGVILYELVTAHPPFAGSTIPEVCVAVMSHDPMPISGFVSPEFQAIIWKCLAKDRGQRFANVAALARELQRFAQEHAHVHAERASLSLRAPISPRAEPSAIGSAPTLLAASERAAPTRKVPDPAESISTWIRPKMHSRVRTRVAWAVFMVGLFASVTTLVAALVSRATKSPPLVPAALHESRARVDMPMPSSEATTPPPPAPPIPPAPPPVVSIDALPRAPKASPEGSTSTAKPSPRVRAPHAVPAVTSAAPLPSTNAAPKEAWPWGDRN